MPVVLDYSSATVMSSNSNNLPKDSNMTAVQWVHALSKERELDMFDWAEAEALERQQWKRAQIYLFIFMNELPNNLPYEVKLDTVMKFIRKYEGPAKETNH